MIEVADWYLLNVIDVNLMNLLYEKYFDSLMDDD